MLRPIMTCKKSRLFTPRALVAFLCASCMNAVSAPVQESTYAECWNENLYKPGHSRSLQYEKIGRDNPVTESISVSEGDDDTIVVSKKTRGGVVPDSPPWKDIYKVDFSAKTTTLTNSKYSGSTASYPPGIVTDYKIKRGESITNEFRDLYPAINKNVSVKSTSTFAGIETIDLPNISDVEACRIETEIRRKERNDATSTTQTRWYAVDSGILLRMSGPKKIRQEFAGESIPLYQEQPSP